MYGDTPLDVAFCAPSRATRGLPRRSRGRARAGRRGCRHLTRSGRLLPTRAARSHHRRRAAGEGRSHAGAARPERRSHAQRASRSGHRTAGTARSARPTRWRETEMGRAARTEARSRRRRRPEAERHDQKRGTRGEEGTEKPAEKPGAEYHAGGKAALLRHYRRNRCNGRGRCRGRGGDGG